jgi:hypothetical protein
LSGSLLAISVQGIGVLGARKSELVNRIDKAIGEVIAVVDRVTVTTSMVKGPGRSGGNQKRPPNDLDPAKASARDVPNERSANANISRSRGIERRSSNLAELWHAHFCIVGETLYMEEPKGWRELQQKALDETDPQSLIDIVDQLMSLLKTHENNLVSQGRSSIKTSVPEATPNSEP